MLSESLSPILTVPQVEPVEQIKDFELATRERERADYCSNSTRRKEREREKERNPRKLVPYSSEFIFSRVEQGIQKNQLAE